MPEIHGSKHVLLHNAVDITQYLKDDLEVGGGDRELHDTTSFGDTDTAHMVSPIKEGVPINIGGIFSTEAHAHFAPLDGETDAIASRPAGTGSGLPALTGNATLTNYKVSSNFNAPATWSAVLTPNAGLTWVTQ
jgi:hypothetical protein